MISIYTNIRELANSRGISIGKLEERAGLSNASICKWNTVSPSANSLKRVADILGCTVDELLTEDDAS